MMFRPIEYAFAFSNYLFWGESPIVIHLMIQKFELSPVICKILYIMNKVLIWIDLDRFEQAETLWGKSQDMEKGPRNRDSQVNLW